MLLDGFAVVSGVPRSGTSMMMQMLNAGGLETLCDYQKQDEFNANGYWDWMGPLRVEHWWEIEELQGRVAKVFWKWLPSEPVEGMRMIWMLRSGRSVEQSCDAVRDGMFHLHREITSCRVILAGVSTPAQRRADAEKVHGRDYGAVLDVSYELTLVDPLGVSREIAGFLGADLDIDKMSWVVDKSMNRF